MKRLLALVAVPVAVLAIAGCTSASHSGMGSMTSMMSGSPSGPSSSDASAADVMFAQMMIPHHQQAVEMSTLAETRASSPFIKDLAVRIKGAQQPEIDLMTSWLKDWGHPVMDNDDMGHMGHGMPGVLTDEQMAELTAATGLAFDQLYAKYMIAHHEGAIDMAEAVADSTNPAVAKLAKDIITGQAAEIAEMKAFLAG